MKTRMAQPGDFAAIREHMDRFLVATETTGEGRFREERLMGCVSLEPYGDDLAEVRSLAVIPEARGRGAGGKLVAAVLDTVRSRGIARVFAVTHAPAVFERHGFVASRREEVPEKIARDCCVCPHAMDCSLVAVVAVVCAERDLLPVILSPSKVEATV